jgi:regulator of sigma D
MFEQTDAITEEISGLCSSIQSDCLFSEKRHLLTAALSSLKSAKEVINALSKTAGDDFEHDLSP